MELSGATPVDTLYEFMGYRLGAQLADAVIWNWVFVGLLVLAALLRLFWTAMQKGSYLQLAVYPVYLAFMLALISPVEVKVGVDAVWDPSQFTHEVETASSRAHLIAGTRSYQRDRTIRVPRILALSHAVTDKLLFAVTGDMEKRTHDTLFRWHRIAAAAEQARIHDGDLRSTFRGFLNACYWLAIAKSQNSKDESKPELDPLEHLPLLDGGTIPYSKRCRYRSGLLHRMLWDNIHDENGPHLQIVEAYKEAVRESRVDPSDAFYRSAVHSKIEKGGFQNGYIQRIVYNETFGPAARNEMATMAKAVPEFTWDPKFYGTGSDGWSLKSHVSGVITVAASILESASQESLGPMLYYRFTLFAPYLYGLIQAVLLIGFPLVGLLSLWPGRWTALMNFFKVWLSVKLWPFFWSFLSAFNSYRLVTLDTEDPRGVIGTGGTAEMFAAVAAMYLLVPVLSFLILNFTVNAASIGISQFVSARGGGLGFLFAGAAVARLLGSPVRGRTPGGPGAAGGSRGGGSGGSGGSAATGGGERAGLRES